MSVTNKSELFLEINNMLRSMNTNNYLICTFLNQEVLTPQGYTHIGSTKVASQAMFLQELYLPT